MHDIHGLNAHTFTTLAHNYIWLSMSSISCSDSSSMATPKRELSYGSVQIYHDEVLGIGAYGKVCKKTI